MTEEFIANLVANISVPAALCFYCLFTLNKSVNKLFDSVNQLIASVKSLENELRSSRR